MGHFKCMGYKLKHSTFVKIKKYRRYIQVITFKELRKKLSEVEIIACIALAAK